MRRALWETVTELVEAVQPANESGVSVRIASLSLDVPIEMLLRPAADALEGVELLGELPRWRWTTAFDKQRGRLQLICQESCRE